jgi:ribosomal protein S6|nr:ribosomal protein S6 [Meringosphaera mediterranea]
MKTIHEINNYESMLILAPQCSETNSHLVADSYIKILKNLGAKNVDINIMGEKTFFYTMNKVRMGRYMLLTFTASPGLLHLYEKRMRLDKNIARFRIFRS